jgi:hypothetical protein
LGRLTLTSGAPVTEADVVGATTVYFTAGDIEIYDGTEWRTYQVGELSLALDSNAAHTNYHQSGLNYDVFAAINGSSVVIGTGPAWTIGGGSATARGTGAGSAVVTTLDGRVVNAVQITMRIGNTNNTTDLITVPANQARLLGTLRTTADGQTEDSKTKRFVSNAINVAVRPIEKLVATASWSGSGAASWRQANNDATNQVELLNCVTGRPVSVRNRGTVSGSTATGRPINIGIGVDRTNGNDGLGTDFYTLPQANAFTQCSSEYNKFPGLGYHKLCMVEFDNASDVRTWFGSSVDAGISGWWVG